MGYNSDTHTITVGPNSDFIADSGVHFIHTYREMAQKPTAPDAIRSDWKTLEDWLGCAGRSLNADDDNRIRRLVGFRYVKSAEWLIIFAVPAATWFGLPHILKWLRGAPRDTRLVFSANVMWIMLVAMWGYIWRWDNELSSERYLALFILPSIAAWIGLFLWRWSKSDQR